MDATSASSSITTAVVRLMHEHTGRGPTKARTIIHPDVIIVTLRDVLGPSERRLVDHGQPVIVLDTRRAYQNQMRAGLIEIVERVMSPRTVEVLLSDTSTESDITVEVFVMHDD